MSEADIITQSALAAVASSRRSPLGHRRRSALPREFRSDFVEDNPSSKREKADSYDKRITSPVGDKQEGNKVK